jgi:hypothetical protein
MEGKDQQKNGKKFFSGAVHVFFGLTNLGQLDGVQPLWP